MRILPPTIQSTFSHLLTMVNKINVRFRNITVVEIAKNLIYEIVKIRVLPQLV